MFYETPISLEPGAEVKLVQLLSTRSKLPRDPQKLSLRVIASERPVTVTVPNPQQWLCPLYQREQELVAQGERGEGAWVLPELCGGPKIAKVADLQGRWLEAGGGTFDGTMNGDALELATSAAQYPRLRVVRQEGPLRICTGVRTGQNTWVEGKTTLTADLKRATFVSEDGKDHHPARAGGRRSRVAGPRSSRPAGPDRSHSRRRSLSRPGPEPGRSARPRARRTAVPGSGSDRPACPARLARPGPTRRVPPAGRLRRAAGPDRPRPRRRGERLRHGQEQGRQGEVHQHRRLPDRSPDRQRRRERARRAHVESHRGGLRVAAGRHDSARRR
jgi:hypothetical protein